MRDFEPCADCWFPQMCGAEPAHCEREATAKNSADLTANLPHVDKIIEDERLAEFNRQVQKVTDQRGQVYGHPSVDFHRVNRLTAVVDECADPLARHALRMICVKLARLIESPEHLDSWIDVAGYARTGVMVTTKRA